MPGQGYNTMGYNPKPYQGTIGGGNMSYNLDKGNKVTPYKGTINPNDRSFKTKEYKQTIDTGFKRKVPPPQKPPKQKPPKAAAPRRAPNPNLTTATVKGYEPNIKWKPGQEQIKPYEPKPYKGSIPSQPTPVKNYELPENYYGFPKGNRRPTPPRQPTPVKEQKIKRNKVQPLEPPPPRQVTPVQRQVTPPKPVQRQVTPPKPEPRHKTPPAKQAPQAMKPTVHDPLIETAAPVMAPIEPPKKKEPKPPVTYAPPPPSPLPPARRNNSPFYNYKPEPIFPPLVPVTADDYTYSYEETTSYYGGPFKKHTSQPLIPATYPMPRYDLQQYQSIPPPKIWTLPEDPYLFKASGVPAYSAVGSILRSSDVYSFYY